MVAISEVPCTLPQLSQHSLAGMSMMGYGNIAKEGQDLNFAGISLLLLLDINHFEIAKCIRKKIIVVLQYNNACAQMSPLLCSKQFNIVLYFCQAGLLCLGAGCIKLLITFLITVS